MDVNKTFTVDETRWTRTFKEKQRVDGTETSKNPSGPKHLKIYGNAVEHRIWTICQHFIVILFIHIIHHL